MVISLILLAISFGIKQNSSLFFSISSFEITALISIAFTFGYFHYQRIVEQQCLYDNEKRREIWECDNYIEGEQKEMIELYTSRGLSKEDAETVIKILSSNKKFFVDLMMKEELQLIPPSSDPFYGAIATTFSILVTGLIPLLPILNWKSLALFDMTMNNDTMMIFSLSLSVITLFILGSTRTLFIVNKWWRSGLQSSITGLLCFGLTFYITTFANKSLPFK